MMKSMKIRLFLILVVTTSVVWISAVAWIFFSTQTEIERVLDDRLMEAANMVSSLLVAQDVEAMPAANMVARHFERPSTYARQLSCQIWSFEGNLLSKSDAAPKGQMTTHMNGFSDTVIDGEVWRVYAVENATLGIRVLVGDTRRIRAGLVSDVIKGFLWPAFVIIPILATLIWLSVRNGLAPLNRIAAGLGVRSASDLSPLRNDQSVSEIKPVIGALNELFRRVADARERERNFTAFAAHELRTPLAGLKAQAQVAMGTNDADVRERALGHIVHSVGRTGRLVRQLLDLASVDAYEANASTTSVNPGEALALLRGEFLANSGRNTQIVIGQALCEIELAIDADLFTLAARNLLENAILHSQAAGTITCDLVATKDKISVAIDDCGPGIPIDEMSQVKERFFRGRNKTVVGSGLGLSIADIALGRAGAMLELHNRAQGGLSARIVVAASSGRSVKLPN